MEVLLAQCQKLSNLVWYIVPAYTIVWYKALSCNAATIKSYQELAIKNKVYYITLLPDTPISNDSLKSPLQTHLMSEHLVYCLQGEMGNKWEHTRIDAQAIVLHDRRRYRTASRLCKESHLNSAAVSNGYLIGLGTVLCYSNFTKC